MKRLFFILALFLPLLITAQPYYISPSGDNTTGNGSRANPWFGAGYAMNQCSPGDTVYALSGTYNYTTQQTISVSGSAGNYITLTSEANHPDSVVFDFWGYDASDLWRPAPNDHIGAVIYGIYAIGRSYLKFERFSLRRLWKINTADGRAHGMYFQNSSFIDFDWLVIDSIAGRGIQGYNSGTANFINCDISWCADPQDNDPGNAGVGIIWYTLTDSFTDTVRVTGCRLWQNADQGIETMHGNVVIVDSTWAWDNDLYDEGFTFATGNGMKPALGFDSNTPITMRRNIIAFNRIGLNENTSSGGYKFNFYFYNNIVYANGGVGIIATEYPNGGHPERVNVYRNNISFDNGSWDMQIQEAADHSYNSFDTPYMAELNNISSIYMNSLETVSTADFIAIPTSKAECTTILAGPRKADGSLPDIYPHFHLASTSDLIDQGIDVGLPYNGTAPDLGAFEYEPSTGRTLLKIGGKFVKSIRGTIVKK